YNAVLDLSTSGGSNIYGSSWVGPLSASFDAENQTVALSMLVNAIALANDTLPSTTTSTISTSTFSSLSTTTSKASSLSSNKTGPIVGGVLGGLTFIALIALSMIYTYRLWRNRQ
ncbi:hypothetical protein K435DRAFT_626381, partial [Dendrothele bispora CBS 962.96]